VDSGGNGGDGGSARAGKGGDGPKGEDDYDRSSGAVVRRSRLHSPLYQWLQTSIAIIYLGK
jgi:hypothetical protein